MMSASDLLAFYHLRPWEHKVGARPLLYLGLAYAVAGQWRWLPMALNGLAALGVYMFAGAFDDYWDARLQGQKNFLSTQIHARRLTEEQARGLAWAPLLLVWPLLGCAQALRLPLRSLGLLLGAGLALLICYSVPPVRLKERSPWGFVIGPLLASLLFLAASIVLRPLTRFLVLFAVLVFAFHCHAEAMHVIDHGSCGRPLRTLSLHSAFRLFRCLPAISFFGSLGFAIISPVFLITSCASLVRWWSVQRLSVAQVHGARHRLWSPVWFLYEFIAYACLGVAGFLG